MSIFLLTSDSYRPTRDKDVDKTLVFKSLYWLLHWFKLQCPLSVLGNNSNVGSQVFILSKIILSPVTFLINIASKLQGSFCTFSLSRVSVDFSLEKD